MKRCDSGCSCPPCRREHGAGWGWYFLVLLLLAGTCDDQDKIDALTKSLSDCQQAVAQQQK